MDISRNIVKKLRENRILNERSEYNKYSRDELIKMAQEGDQLAVELLLKSHKDFIKKMSSKYFLGSGDQDDIEQIATIAFWDAIMKWDMTGDFEAFAGMIIKRKMADEINKEATDKRQLNNLAKSLEDTIAGDDEGGESTVGDTVASKGLSPEEEYLGKDGARRLMDFMREKFSQKERDVVMLHIKGYKIADIMEETGMSYKSVENTLMRIKNKLADYIRNSYTESKKMRRSKDIKFSDEEKKVLESVITKINEEESLRESRVTELRKKYEKYTESQLEDELIEIEDRIQEIERELEKTDYDDRDDLLEELDDLKNKLYSMEDYIPDHLAGRCERAQRDVRNAKYTEYEDAHYVDPFTERGLRRSDFF